MYSTHKKRAVYDDYAVAINGNFDEILAINYPNVQKNRILC